MISPLLRALLLIYRLGIFLAVIIAFSGGPFFRNLGVKVPDFSNYLLPFGIGHMLILSVLGIAAPKADKLMAGSKIQTAGYLHTLIGFAAALILLSPEKEATLNNVLAPLGSAVGTSIIGWFVGGELVEREPVRHEDFIDYKMDAVAKELEGFATAIHEVHKEYVDALKEAVSQLEREIDTLRKAKTISSEIGGMLVPFSSSIESLLRNLREIESKSLEAKNGIAETAMAAKDVAKYLKESRVLIEELERLLDFVTRSKRT